MNQYVKGPNDLVSGVALVGLSLFAWWLVVDLPMGTATRMGPGFIPVGLCWIGIGLGVLLVGRAFFVDGPTLEPWGWWPLAVITAAVSTFMVVQKAGLVIAVALVTIVASLGARPLRIREIMILAALLATFSALVFVKALGLPMQLWPRL
ncbi:MAG: tripartite tricarboxylate transporter TctB family protein [Proteobacteria bacterium]|nr:tripartite tricarboxylate transporter TctB family protein [Pseudomonadota bacterium]